MDSTFKLILDTDIGTNVDDAWALLFALACSKFELKAVTLVHANLDVRALIALKILKLAGREDIPVYKGMRQTLSGDAEYWGGYEGSETDFSDIDSSKAQNGGVEAIIRTVENFPGETVLASIGPMTNIAAAIQNKPEIAALVKKCSIMGTTFNGIGDQNAGREHNAFLDPAASKIVLESGIPALILGYNVTVQTVLTNDYLDRISSKCPLAEYMTAMSRQYQRITGRDFCHMHDGLALAALVDPTIVKTRQLKPVVREDGLVSWHEPKYGDIALSVAVDVDTERFDDVFLGSIEDFLGEL